MAVTTPSVNSYLRIRPHYWSGAFRCWGLDNREAAVRVPTNPAGTGTTNIELKTHDASANPYLALGVVIAAGLDGIRRQLDPGPPIQVDPGNLSDDERRAQGIAPLPADLGKAIELLAADHMLQDALGADLARAFLAVRRAEWQAMKEMPLSDQVKLLLERY
jgi:glutamine synthetase